jgi:hypothetical protein
MSNIFHSFPFSLVAKRTSIYRTIPVPPYTYPSPNLNLLILRIITAKLGSILAEDFVGKYSSVN